MSRTRTATALILAALAAALALPGAGAALPTHRAIEGSTESFLASRATAPAPLWRAGVGVGDPLDVPVFPAERIVAFYGAPQMGATILGMKAPAVAAARLAKQSAPYAEKGDRPVSGAFDLVSVFATAGGGPDGRYRTRQDPEVIQIYLDQARAVGARLVLDIQPGRSSFLRELEVLAPWLAQPDVDLALDAEWNVGRKGIPGKTKGKVTADEVNEVADALAEIVKENDLPPKLLLVHQFRKGSVRGRKHLDQNLNVETVLNFDGIGSPAAKANGYASLQHPGIYNGFSLFYERDEPLMKPSAVLGLETQPDFVLYQ